MEDSKDLLALAESVQDEARTLEEREEFLKRLSDRYHDWYHDALALFDTRNQAGERQKFEQEYAGSFWSPKIVTFLTEGNQVSPLYDPRNPLLDKWTHPVTRSFEEPLLKQRSVVAGLGSRSSTAASDAGREEAWNATIRRIFTAFIEKAEDAKTNNQKKLTYEYLALFLIGAVEGLTVISHDKRGPSEEVDVWVANESKSSFWQRVGNPFLVECKNWNKLVTASEVRNLSAVMRNKNVKFAILMSKNGVTGEEGRDALGEIKNAFRDERHILVLDHTDLLEIANGLHPEEKIKGKLYELFMSS